MLWAIDDVERIYYTVFWGLRMRKLSWNMFSFQRRICQSPPTFRFRVSWSSKAVMLKVPVVAHLEGINVISKKHNLTLLFNL
ncbi:hypothetical protein CMV_025821 [Castanea mollissima]|uniref:Uncharacterized protein n=1 Tax=Castanea mollissima TaxID=60419 RepID=A0A8J4QNJ5_9ROSI|nr:hypothetical protein CMV_025821 [Castanea mollissima]